MILFIDTTQKWCVISIISSKKIICFSQEISFKNTTDILIEKIDYLLKSKNISKKNINKIYFLLGPGSFNGCRMGYIVAKLWGLVEKIKVYTMNSLLFQLKNGTGISLINAKSNKFYVAIYKNYKEIHKPSLINSNYLNAFIKKYKGFKIYKDYQNFDYKENILKKIKHFEENINLKKVEPFYLKGI